MSKQVTGDDVSDESTSHLPSWVLKMRSKIAESRMAHTVVEQRICILSNNVSQLSTKLKEVQKSTKIDETNTSCLTKHDNSCIIRINSSSLTQQKITQPNTKKKHYIFQVELFPQDILVLIMYFLDLYSISTLECVSTGFHEAISKSIIWRLLFKSMCSHLQCPSIILSVHHQRHMTLNFVKNVRMTLQFINLMKEQRCIPKHSSIQPHRHSKSDKTVTHPLPMFDNNLLSEKKDELIMSHTETLSTEFRSRTHFIMEKIIFLTSTYSTVIEKLCSEGIITILVSLLSNEEGIVQNYACEALANILFWEAKQFEYLEFNSNKDDLYPSFKFELQTLRLPKNKVKEITVFNQVKVCNGHRSLVGLLTSPSASINLAGTTGKCSGGFKELRMTASVQGVSSKQASRALICLFHPQSPVPIGKVRFHNLSTLKSCTDNNAKQRNGIECKSSSESFINSKFILDEHPRKWLFTYYHKSGSFKDEFHVYLSFNIDGFVKGRGVDNIGLFYMSGHVDKEINDWAWYFHKTYLRQNIIDENSIVYDEWIQQVDDDEEIPKESINSRTTVHVSHIGYYSDSHFQLNHRGGEGLWGVWETSSSSNHFELLKGGVFRAVPTS
eukprot:gene12248-16420_t